ncbi:uncharacterized protein PAC_15814 [Phialocephala subalpina]|uniref:Uncharacterized protein n=1 Tax=Phialocephala subalpina TaxID=576137 RepID=A0A1L7XLN1_9HELO|nr:uncharacterized protein PAC_15814 [Phialocephala subalpina]
MKKDITAKLSVAEDFWQAAEDEVKEEVGYHINQAILDISTDFSLYTGLQSVRLSQEYTTEARSVQISPEDVVAILVWDDTCEMGSMTVTGVRQPAGSAVGLLGDVDSTTIINRGTRSEKQGPIQQQIDNSFPFPLCFKSFFTLITKSTMASPNIFSDTLTNLSRNTSSLSIKLLHWNYGTTSKNSPIRDPPCKCKPLNDLAVNLQFIPIVTNRCDRVIKVLTTGVETVRSSISDEDEKAGLSGEELWKRLICGVGVMESLIWLTILQVGGKLPAQACRKEIHLSALSARLQRSWDHVLQRHLPKRTSAPRIPNNTTTPSQSAPCAPLLPPLEPPSTSSSEDQHKPILAIENGEILLAARKRSRPTSGTTNTRLTMKRKNRNVPRWQYPMSTMDILLQLPAEVAWSVSNILNARIIAREIDRKGEKMNWSVELVAEWPVPAAVSRDMAEGKRCIQFKFRSNTKARAEKDLKKMERGKVNDYLVTLRSVTHGKEITVPMSGSKRGSFSFTFKAEARKDQAPYSEKVQTGFCEMEEKKMSGVGEDKLSMKQKAMIINDFLASFSALHDGSTREKRAGLLMKIVDESCGEREDM